MADYKAKMEDARKRAVMAADEMNSTVGKVASAVGPNMFTPKKDFENAIKDFEKVPQKVRDKEAYNQSGHKKGGSIRGGGVESRGKTKGQMV